MVEYWKIGPQRRDGALAEGPLAKTFNSIVYSYLLFIFYIFKNITRLAVQCLAQRLQG